MRVSPCRDGGVTDMHWQWLVGPSAALLAVATALAGLGQTGTVADELSRVVGLVVPLVAALLSPLVAAIIFLFRTLVAEMRANRAQGEQVTAVVASNTTAFNANTAASERLTDSVAALNARMDRLEMRVERGDHDDHERRKRP